MVATVQQNESTYTKREVKRAQEARALQQRLGNPPDAKLSQALAHGNILGSTIMPADITRATDIYGTNTHALQGRTTTPKPSAFPDPPPRRISEPQAMYANVFTACGTQFLITITKLLEHILCSSIDSRDTPSMRNVMRKHTGF
jgi:hypothetical protein